MAAKRKTKTASLRPEVRALVDRIRAGAKDRLEIKCEKTGPKWAWTVLVDGVGVALGHQSNLAESVGRACQWVSRAGLVRASA